MSGSNEEKIGEPWLGPYEVATHEHTGYSRLNQGQFVIRGPDPSDPGFHIGLAHVLMHAPSKRGAAYSTPDPVALGTAHLMAAAWDLRDALVEAYDELCNWLDKNERASDPTMLMIRLALWKAKGEAPEAHRRPKFEKDHVDKKGGA